MRARVCTNVVSMCSKHVGTCQRSIYSYRNLSWHLHAAVPPSVQRATLVVYCVTQTHSPCAYMKICPTLPIEHHRIALQVSVGFYQLNITDATFAILDDCPQPSTLFSASRYGRSWLAMAVQCTVCSRCSVNCDAAHGHSAD